MGRWWNLYLFLVFFEYSDDVSLLEVDLEGFLVLRWIVGCDRSGGVFHRGKARR